MTPTDLTALTPPAPCRDWLPTADPQAQIVDHAITVDLTWWNRSLQDRGLPGGPLVGTDETGRVVDHGLAHITRGDLFTRAAAQGESPAATLTVLWHVLAWGTGRNVRLVHKRMNAIAADRSGAEQTLRTAAALSHTDPHAAYATLYPRRSPLIAHLGPAFLTKYLYFAGAGRPEHPCLILDTRVARALASAGWLSLHPRGGWPPATYARYCTLAQRWAHECGAARPDLVEKWLFDHGTASSNPPPG
ncbi:MAG: hypothetical protein WAX14_17440 [Rhodococcus sp. (in: high G+C Gram-positive bacteria)]|uniref:8-oxoguanine DNA glycosylase OGG fold protein n=1 Tax=Rhodococcus sp. TaxID=1831 RepID=UPI003BB6C3C2